MENRRQVAESCIQIINAAIAYLQTIGYSITDSENPGWCLESVGRKSSTAGEDTYYFKTKEEKEDE